MAIKLVENYSVSLARNSVRDSLMSHGEECIALAMYHVNADEAIQPRCPVCFDDIYKSPDQLCSRCYGTTFDLGVKTAARVWGMFSDHVYEETFRQHGVYATDQREMQIEAFPVLMQHDYIVRVRRWDDNHTPLEIEGYYEVTQVTRDSMRTGNRFGQYTWDIIGQKVNVTELQKNSVITQFPVLNVVFPEAIQVGTTVAPPVVQPDTKVVYYPLPTTPSVDGGLYNVQGFSFIQQNPSAIWTIENPLGRFPAGVTVIDESGNVVNAEVDFPDIRTIVVTFSQPRTGRVEVV